MSMRRILEIAPAGQCRVPRCCLSLVGVPSSMLWPKWIIMFLALFWICKAVRMHVNLADRQSHVDRCTAGCCRRPHAPVHQWWRPAAYICRLIYGHSHERACAAGAQAYGSAAARPQCRTLALGLQSQPLGSAWQLDLQCMQYLPGDASLVVCAFNLQQCCPIVIFTTVRTPHHNRCYAELWVAAAAAVRVTASQSHVAPPLASESLTMD